MMQTSPRHLFSQPQRKPVISYHLDPHFLLTTIMFTTDHRQTAAKIIKEHNRLKGVGVETGRTKVEEVQAGLGIQVFGENLKGEESGLEP
jgi:hypothetical protein